MSGILMCDVRISAQRYSTTKQPSQNIPDGCFEFQSFTKKRHCKGKGMGNIPRHSKQRSLLENRARQNTSTKSETPKLLFSGIFAVLTSDSYSVNSQEIGMFIAQGCEYSDGGGLFY